MGVSHGGVTGGCHRGVSQGGVTGGCHRGVSHGGVTWGCHRKVQPVQISLYQLTNQPTN